jgi:hypothetical protein
MSWMVTIPGWFKALAALASRTKRRFARSIGKLLGGQHLHRDRPIEAGIVALVDDTPMPPSPSFDSMR